MLRLLFNAYFVVLDEILDILKNVNHPCPFPKHKGHVMCGFLKKIARENITSAQQI